MLGLIVRIFFVLAGSIASWFIARDALKFEIVQMIIAVFLFTLAVAVVAFWPMLKDWIKDQVKQKSLK